MKSLILLAIAALALTGCEKPSPHSERAHLRRSRAVLTCPNGVVIGYDPTDKVFAWTNGEMYGDLLPGISPVRFCTGAYGD